MTFGGAQSQQASREGPSFTGACDGLTQWCYCQTGFSSRANISSRVGQAFHQGPTCAALMLQVVGAFKWLWRPQVRCSCASEIADHNHAAEWCMWDHDTVTVW